jgi:hypothetical protein
MFLYFEYFHYLIGVLCEGSKDFKTHFASGNAGT